MPSANPEPQWKTLTVKELHPTFAAEVHGVDFHDLGEEQLKEITEAIAKYGVLVFRNTNLSDDEHIAFSRRLGDLDDMRRYLNNGRKPRYGTIYLFDAGNIADDGSLMDPNTPRAHANKGNSLFHTDSSFNPRRASYSLLRSCILPPPSTGGTTDFADTRTAFSDLPAPLKSRLLASDPVGYHTFANSRKKGSPDYFKDLKPEQFPMAKHKVVQVHEGSGRGNLYVGAHLHHIEGLDGLETEVKGLEVEGKEGEATMTTVEKLNVWVTQEKYVCKVAWEGVGDMVMWDNRCTLHRAGKFAGGYKRDMRRTTVHDGGAGAWGLNEVGKEMPGFVAGERASAP